MLSGDGGTVVGARLESPSIGSASQRLSAFLDGERADKYPVFTLSSGGQWSSADLPEGLGKPDAIDRVGSRIVGHLRDAPARGYVYSTHLRTIMLTPFSAGSFSEDSTAWGISPNGRFVVGNRKLSSSSAPVGVRWDTTTNAQYLVPVFSGAIETRPTLCTDGGLVGGWFRTSAGTLAFRGTWAGDLAGGRTDARPRAFSHDGGVMVGRGTSCSFLDFTTYHAFAWTGTGMRNINPAGPTNRLFGSGANDCTADGTTAVGTMYSEFDIYNDAHAFIWRQNSGTMKLRDYLIQAYPEMQSQLQGLTLQHGIGVSDDGRTIVGYDVTRQLHPIDDDYVYTRFVTWVVRLPDVRPFPAPPPW